MSNGRLALSTFAAFLVSQVLAVFIHGFVLAGDYAPYEGTLLRSGVAWQMTFLPVVHLSFICGLMWIYTHTPLNGSAVTQGITLGSVGWVVGQVPMWLLWFAQQPWPGTLVVKQLGLELVSSLLIGLTISYTARQPQHASALARTA